MKEHEINFVKTHVVGVISTCANNKPHGVPIYYSYIQDEHAFYFVTKDTTKKILNIKENSATHITIFQEDPQVTFSADCEASLIDCGESSCKEILNELIGVHSKQKYYPTPLSALKDGSLTLVKLQVLAHTFNSYK